MKKKAGALIVISTITILLGIITFAVTLFINMILDMDNSWFISRFGPDGESEYRTYDKLYEMSLVLVNSANRYSIAFYISLGLGLVAFGVICGLWARDIRGKIKGVGWGCCKGCR